MLSFLNTYAEAKVLSAPRTVTLDNEPAHISVTRASPIFNITAGTANTTGGSQIQDTNLGVILHVTPRISANNYVNLKVTPEVSRIFDTVTRTVGGEEYQADEYDVRRMETRVLIPSGNTLVLGGMVQDDVSHSSTKVPLLGDIPYLGSLIPIRNQVPDEDRPDHLRHSHHCSGVGLSPDQDRVPDPSITGERFVGTGSVGLG